MMKKFFLSIAVAGLFIVYIVIDRFMGNTRSFSVAPGIASPTTEMVVPPVQRVKSLYRDGKYTGAVVDAYFGNVQVTVIVQEGKITGVQFLQYPNDRSTSREISAMAMPLLKSEAIAAQSANVDIVSGATQTSSAFKQSLADALSQAST